MFSLDLTFLVFLQKITGGNYVNGDNDSKDVMHMVVDGDDAHVKSPFITGRRSMRLDVSSQDQR